MQRLLPRAVPLWTGLCTLSALAILCTTGFSTRLWADDYCYSAMLRQQGFWKAQVEFYLTTSDRYSVIPLVGVSEWFGAAAIRFLPTLAALGMTAVLLWLLRRLQPCLGEPRLGMPLLLALHLALFSLLMTPNLFQVFYWRTGMLTYFMPLVMQVCLAAILLRPITSHKTSALRLAGILLLAFFSGGFSETTAALQTAALVLTLTAAWVLLKADRRKAYLLAVCAALLGSLLAMLALFLSPAAQLRQQQHFAPPPALWPLLDMSFRFALDFILYTLRGLPLPALVATAIPLALAASTPPGASPARPSRLLITLLLTWTVAYLLIASSIAPSVYAQSAYPEARALVPATFLLVSALSLSGWLLGKLALSLPIQLAVRSSAFLLLLVLLSLYPLRAGLLAARQLPLFQQRAAQWDERDLYIRTAIAEGAQDLTVPALDSIAGLSEMGSDPSFFVNRCSADYYGLLSLRAE